MRENATLKLDAGDELRVEVDRAELHQDEIVVRRTGGLTADRTDGLLAAIDAHLTAATPHPAGTTDRLLAADPSSGTDREFPGSPDPGFVEAGVIPLIRST